MDSAGAGMGTQQPRGLRERRWLVNSRNARPPAASTNGQAGFDHPGGMFRIVGIAIDCGQVEPRLALEVEGTRDLHRARVVEAEPPREVLEVLADRKASPR